MKIIKEKLTLDELNRMDANMFGDMVKAVVDGVDSEETRKKNQRGHCKKDSAMSYQHETLAAGRWNQLSFLEQMANIGSEVERALNWRAKNNAAYSQKAFKRALELVDLTLENAKSFPRTKELARVREIWVDYFSGTNLYRSTESSWRKYFYHFNFAARRDR